MAHNKLTQAIRIYLRGDYTENTPLGIYVNAGVSEIRISEDTLIAPTLAWTSGLIALNGIGDIRESMDTRQGGAVAAYEGIDIQLIDTNRYILELKDLGIFLTGCACEIYEFTAASEGAAQGDGAVIMTGVIGEILWDETIAAIPVKNARYKRDANLTTEAENGVVYPVTFGKLYPTFDASGNMDSKAIAKFVRTSAIEDKTTYSNAYFEATGQYPEQIEFPVYAISAPTSAPFVNIEIRGTDKFSSGWYVDPVDTYLFISSGDGDGQYKKIVRIEYLNPNVYRCSVDSMFTVSPSGVGATAQSWVKILVIKIEQVFESWKCKSFLDLLGNEIIQAPKIFTYENDELTQAMDYGYECKNISALNNKIAIVPIVYTDDINTLDSLIVSPAKTVYPIDTANLADWNNGDEDWWDDYDKLITGAYGHVDHISGSLQNASNAIDKDSTTAATFNLAVSQDSSIANYFKCIGFTLPDAPIADWDEAYIGIKMDTFAKHGYEVNSDSALRIMVRKWKYGVVRAMAAYKIKEDGASGAHVGSLPDFYYSDDVTGKYNKDYFYKSQPVAGAYPNITGYEYFILAGVTKENYQSFVEGIIILHRAMYFGNSDNDNQSLYELAIMFKKSGQNIKETVFSPAAGRIYNDTWGSRKTAADMIASPVPMIEHLKRLQNWGETGETGTIWGREYAASAKIKTSGDGSFDDTALLTLTDQAPAFQTFEKDECQVSNLVNKLCKTFDLLSYIDKDGYECIGTLALTNPTETITFDDLQGDVGPIQEPQLADIYCEPLVNYQYSTATEKFGKTLAVKNIQNYVKGDNWADCSIGFASLADAESVLDLAYALWTRYGHVEPPPSDYTDKEEIQTYADALAYLVRKLSHCAKQRVSLSVDYDKGSNYNAGTHVQLNLPHQTYGQDVECLIEAISKSKNNNKCDLDLVILEDIVKP